MLAMMPGFVGLTGLEVDWPVLCTPYPHFLHLDQGLGIGLLETRCMRTKERYLYSNASLNPSSVENPGISLP